MNSAELRQMQAPFKEKYKADPASALLTLRAIGQLEPGAVCRLIFSIPPETAGLHPAAGGDGKSGCPAELLLHSLVGCAGVTLGAVATAMEIPIEGGTITAEGDVDFRGTLGINRDVPVGYQEIRLVFDLKSTAPADKIQKLIELTERYCVVYQTLRHSPKVTNQIA